MLVLVRYVVDAAKICAAGFRVIAKLGVDAAPVAAREIETCFTAAPTQRTWITITTRIRGVGTVLDILIRTDVAEGTDFCAVRSWCCAE